MKMVFWNSNHTSSRFYTGGIILVIITAMALLALIGKQRISLSGDKKNLESSSQAGQPVNVVKATRAPDERMVTLPGEARPYATVTLYAKVSGYIKEIRVDKGDKVQADQIIAIIESPELTRQYDAAVADAKNKRLDAERALQLFNTGAVSSQSFHGSDTTAEIAEKTAASLLAQKEYPDHACALFRHDYGQICRSRRSGTGRDRRSDFGVAYSNSLRDGQTQGICIS